MADEIKVGVLVKKSRNRSGLTFGTNWQERKITLFATALTYGPVDGPAKDSIPLSPSTTVQLAEDKPFCFKITTSDDELTLCCPNEEERTQWMTAISTVVSGPAVNEQEEKERKAVEVERLRIARELERKEEAERLARAAETEAMRKKREEAEAITRKAREEAEARRAAEAAAAAAKRKLYTTLESPIACQKKLSTESSYHERFIWVNPTTKEFHWAKSGEDTTKSKCISITKHIASVSANSLKDITQPNFTVLLAEPAELPESVFSSKLFASSMPTSIDIYMDDASLSNGFVSFITEMKGK